MNARKTLTPNSSSLAADWVVVRVDTVETTGNRVTTCQSRSHDKTTAEWTYGKELKRSKLTAAEGRTCEHEAYCGFATQLTNEIIILVRHAARAQASCRWCKSRGSRQYYNKEAYWNKMFLQSCQTVLKVKESKTTHLFHRLMLHLHLEARLLQVQE